MPFIAFDCEGPLTLNDNAFEYTAFLIPKGEYFFTQISRFDDYLADIKKRPGYKAGDTLKLILPFLKLFGATNKSLEEFSSKTLILLPGVEKVLPKLQKIIPTFIISTSYTPYLRALAERINFPMSNIFCTEVDLDRIQLSQAEKRVLEALYKEILSFPPIEIPKGAKTVEDLDPDLKNILERMEEIFFDIIWQMDIGILLRKTNPIGGPEKARACEFISNSLNLRLSEGIYCGDSITDVEALSLVKKEGGVSLSFNGNRYALRAGEFYVLSETAYFFEELVKVFLDGGKDALSKLISKERDFEFGRIPKEGEEFWQLVEKSESFRKKVRGQLIGALG